MPDFAASTGPHRAELVVHCYRLLGSVHEAEDLVQETMLRAWRAWERYDSTRASIRTWLYRIATNACLTALEGRARRPLPTGLGGPSEDPLQPLVPAFDVPWLQPLPDDPAAVTAARSGVRLAFVAAMQLLPPRQRAVLVLRDVLDFSAAEVADLLGTTTASVNSALQRARSGVAGVSADELTESGEEVIDDYVRAFEKADVEALVALLTDEVVLEMPPVPLWYRGRDDYARFMARVFEMRGTRWQLQRTHANGQPAFAAYCWDGSDFRLHTVQVFSIADGRVAHTVVFQDPAVFEVFGLAPVLTR
ncbi:sigma-70 family RNA polymerase sigma factor [Amycolatopsis sp. DSM 110486]|uniref:sigma-70 family RNA polymerase sigma factor n=1 Tax=Amycolatopsis sp. DSM 110486 TaxID=2865832 RepID=UPI001C695739|nr:sigma-70 family RNA polymerase sigma factor [Amycolatopsis sp. DSM 110486]QYN21787.1 sigma-70 family RNA polymerase sigma factor [Amycolatopsis sp. DSM 110486]